MKARDEARLLALRMLISAIRNKQIEIKKRDEAGEELIIQVVQSEIKKRRDAAEAYCQGGREELAEREEAEIKILEKYLPEQMSEAEIREIAKEIAEARRAASDNSQPNFGAIMGQVMGRCKGKADGTTVSRIVKEILG